MLYLLLYTTIVFCSVESLHYDIKIRKFHPKEADTYACIAYKIPKDTYGIEFQPLAKKEDVHHMILSYCKEKARSLKQWDTCFSACDGPGKYVYAWAMGAGGTKLPTDVGFKLESGHYLVLQLHYKRDFEPDERDSSGVRVILQEEQPSHLANILLLAAGFILPPNKLHIEVDDQCIVDTKINVFAIRMHAHGHGRMNYLWHRNKGTDWQLLLNRSPQEPQIFQILDSSMEVPAGDTVALRCIFNTTGETEVIRAGPKHTDEMCNGYMMYYTEKSDVDPVGCDYPKPDDEFEQPETKESSLAAAAGGKEKQQTISHFTMDKSWPIDAMKHGQIGGLEINKRTGNLLIFDRIDHVWTGLSFDRTQRYSQRAEGPIEKKAIQEVDAKNSLVRAFGEDAFYLPHGIASSASEDVVWVTDVALHQVVQLTGGKITESLGTKFVPGSKNKKSDEVFCQPADIAITKEFLFVADGYCNSRISKFDKNGDFVTSFGEKLDMTVVHCVIASPKEDKLFVCDRENGRLVAFNSHGDDLFEMTDDELIRDARLFDLSILPNGMLIGLFNIEEEAERNVIVVGFIDIEKQRLLQTFNLTQKEVKGDWLGHALVTNGSDVFVGTISTDGVGSVLKYQFEFSDSSENTSESWWSYRKVYDRIEENKLAAGIVFLVVVLPLFFLLFCCITRFIIRYTRAVTYRSGEGGGGRGGRRRGKNDIEYSLLTTNVSDESDSDDVAFSKLQSNGKTAA